MKFKQLFFIVACSMIGIEMLISGMDMQTVSPLIERSAKIVATQISNDNLANQLQCLPEDVHALVINQLSDDFISSHALKLNMMILNDELSFSADSAIMHRFSAADLLRIKAHNQALTDEEAEVIALDSLNRADNDGKIVTFCPYRARQFSASKRCVQTA